MYILLQSANPNPFPGPVCIDSYLTKSKFKKNRLITPLLKSQIVIFEAFIFVLMSLLFNNYYTVHTSLRLKGVSKKKIYSFYIEIKYSC